MKLSPSAILIIAVSLITIFAIILLCVTIFKKQNPSFTETMNAKKNIRFSIMIDIKQDFVEIYSVYETNNKTKTMSYEEFTYSFDNENLNKLKDWLDRIDKNDDVAFLNSEQLEVAMYDFNGKKRLYRCTLQNFIKDRKKYFLNAQDITDNNPTIKEYENKLSQYSSEKFYEKINFLMEDNLDNEMGLLISIRYKGYYSITKNYELDYIKLIDYEILNRLEAICENDMAICQGTDSIFYIFISKVLVGPLAKTTKQKIKKILQTCSGTIEVNKAKFNLSFATGIKEVRKFDDLQVCMEMAKKALIRSFRKADDKIVYFDTSELAEMESVLEIKKAVVKQLVDNEDFQLIKTPIIDIKSRLVYGYAINILFNQTFLRASKVDDLNSESIFYIAQDIGERKRLVEAILNRIIDLQLDKPIFINFSYLQVAKFCEICFTQEKYKNLPLNFIISFDNFSNTETNLINLERLINNVEKHNMHCGLAIRNYKKLSIAESVYNKLKYMLIQNAVIEESFNLTSHKIGLDSFIQTAKKYNLKVIGAGISNPQQYEKMYDINADYLTGSFFNEKVKDGKLDDKAFLDQIDEIEEHVERL